MEKINLDSITWVSQEDLGVFENLDIYRIRNKKSKATDLLDKEDIIVCASSLEEARRTAYDYMVSVFDTESKPFVYGRILSPNYTEYTKIGITNKYPHAQVISYL